MITNAEDEGMENGEAKSLYYERRRADMRVLVDRIINTLINTCKTQICLDLFFTTTTTNNLMLMLQIL